MINVEKLVKNFGKFTAVQQISFQVKSGEVLGFLGPNGAGKSTTMRMLTGYLTSSSGTVTINGVNIDEEPAQAKKFIGYLPENAPSYPDMTVEDFLDFAAEIRGLKGSAKRDAVKQAITTCRLDPVRHQTIETLSKGFRHRVCFAQAILHDPPILILDEPTDGLDPNQKHEMRELIKTLGHSKAIIVSTHILEEVESICNRVIIIDHGSIVFDGTPAELRHRSPDAGNVWLTLADGAACDTVWEQLRQLPELSSAKKINQETFVLTPAKPDFPLAPRIKQFLDEHKINFTELHTEPGHLEDVFRLLTGNSSSTVQCAASDDKNKQDSKK